MSADLLRRAAASIREKAEAAAAGEWVQNGFEYEPDSDTFTYDVAATSDPVRSLCYAGDRANAEHIASWHPAVALAVAELLDRAASYWIPDPHGEDEDVACCCCPHRRDVVKLARAYLREDA